MSSCRAGLVLPSWLQLFSPLCCLRCSFRTPPPMHCGVCSQFFSILFRYSDMHYKHVNFSDYDCFRVWSALHVELGLQMHEKNKAKQKPSFRSVALKHIYVPINVKIKPTPLAVPPPYALCIKDILSCIKLEKKIYTLKASPEKKKKKKLHFPTFFSLKHAEWYFGDQEHNFVLVLF